MTGNENTIYIGTKPTMNYVLALVMQFHNHTKEIKIKARGKAISKAVDVVEIARNKFVKEMKVKNIEVNTEEITTDKGSRNVSTMTISIGKE